MASTTPGSSFSAEDDRLFLALEDYCWEDDPEFQSGLNQILAATIDPAQVRLLTRQAKCFFYSRKIDRQIPYPLYAAWLDREESSPPRHSPSRDVGPPIDPSPLDAIARIPTASTSTETPVATSDTAGATIPDDKTPFPTSFAEIVDLITSGKPIPGIREIPNTLNSAPPTQSTAQQRRKPWETAIVQDQPAAGSDSLPTPAPTPQV